MQTNSSTGIVTAYAQYAGGFATAIKVKEYRNGVF